MNVQNKERVLFVIALISAGFIWLFGMDLKPGKKMIGELLNQQQVAPLPAPLGSHHEGNAANRNLNDPMRSDSQRVGVTTYSKNKNSTSNAENEKIVTWLQLVKRDFEKKSPDLLREHVIVFPGALKVVQNEPDGKKKSMKKILLWNSPDFYFGVGHSPFVSAECPVSDCYITTNRTEIDYSELDAVVWRPVGPDKTFPPAFRSARTRFVYFLWEPPCLSNSTLNKLEGVVNYTMTFRRDSDIFNPYGIFAPLSTPRTDLVNKNYAEGKTKFAVWFVSNCHARSKREDLVQKLRSYFSVDVYGRCGTKQCSRSSPEACYKRAAQTYKFYFSFENAFCDQYITEKFFWVASYDILPVVYGLGPYDDFAPPHSYINALDFASIRHLADYLIFLDHNVTAYNEYFQWKVHYEASYSHPHHHQHRQNISWCQLCEKLHSDQDARVHTNLNEWNKKSHTCLWPSEGALKQFLNEETIV